jgi:hypothetical protein
MSNTFTKIGEVALTSPGGFSFTSIPSTYDDLKLICNFRTSFNGPDAITFALGGVFGTAGRLFFNFDPNANVGGGAVGYIGATNNTFTSNMFANHEVIIPNYTSSNHNNVIVNGTTPNADTTAYRLLESLTYPLTSAVTSITISTGSSGLPYIVGSYVSLYGIKKTL